MIFITTCADGEGLHASCKILLIFVYISKDDIFDDIWASRIEISSIYQNKASKLFIYSTGNTDSTIVARFRNLEFLKRPLSLSLYDFFQ